MDPSWPFYSVIRFVKSCEVVQMLSSSEEIQKAVDTLKDDLLFPFEASRKLQVTHGVSGSRVPLSSLWSNETNSNTVMVVFGRNLL